MKNIYECHCHISLDGIDFAKTVDMHKNSPDTDHIRSVFETYRSMGVTYVRDGGDKWGVAAAAIDLAEEYGIEYASPLFPIYKKGNYGEFISRCYDTMSDFRELVKEVKAGGGSFVKIMAAGIMDFDRFGVLTGWALEESELSEMVNIAHGEGFAVMAHVNGSDGVKRCVEAGVDSVEHGNYLDESALKYLADSSCIWVPTAAATKALIGKGQFSEENLAAVFEMQKKNISLGAKLGVSIAAGSDAGARCVTHSEGILSEIDILTQYISEEKLSETQERLRQTFKRQG